MNDHILWQVSPSQLPHFDRIELSGMGCSFMVTYGANVSAELSKTSTLYPTISPLIWIPLASMDVG